MSDKADSASTKRLQADLADLSLGKRIRSALGERDFAWLSRQTGISTSTLSDYSRGKLPRADKALQIARALGVSFEFLMGEDEPSPETWYLDTEAAAATRTDTVGVAEVDLRYGLGATYLDSPIEAKTREFSRTWLRNFTDSAPENLFWTQGQGDSMMPTILDSDIVLIDRLQVSPMMGDFIWAFAFGQVGMIKRLRPMPDGSVKILSDNPSVPPEIAVDDELHVIGRVVAIVRRV